MAKSDRNEPVVGTPGVIKIKLGACLTGPTKRLVADLHMIALELIHARNATVRGWERLREAAPDWQPGQRRDRQGNPKFTRKLVAEEGVKMKQLRDGLKDGTFREDGEQVRNRDGGVVGHYEQVPVVEDACLSQSMENELYYIAQRAAPMVAAKIISAVRVEIVDRLRSKMPYNHTGKAKFRYEAIMMNEAARDCYSAISIPVPNQDTVLAVQTKDGPAISKDLDRSRMVQCVAGGACIRFPLFSNASGRENKSVICRIETRQMSRGHRAILAKLARGEWKISDSELVWKEGKVRRGKGKKKGKKRRSPAGAWFLHLVYRQPRIDLGLDPARVATLTPLDKEASHPFEIAGPESFPWKIGDAAATAQEFERLEMRREILRKRYRDGTSAQTGHGRRHFERTLKPVTRMVRNLIERFIRRVAAQVVQYCQKYDCGTLDYKEPKLHQRQFSWFAARDVNCDWTAVLSKIAHKCEKYGIRLLVNGKERKKRAS